MRPLGFWVLFLVAFLTFSCCCGGGGGGGGGGGVSDSAFISYDDETTMNQGGAPAVITNRRLKERSYGISSARSKRDLNGVYLEDYPRFDPTPSSKAAIKAGPIEHGTPLMPYIPRPTPAAPPGHPRHGSP